MTRHRRASFQQLLNSIVCFAYLYILTLSIIKGVRLNVSLCIQIKHSHHYFITTLACLLFSYFMTSLLFICLFGWLFGLIFTSQSSWADALLAELLRSAILSCKSLRELAQLERRTSCAHQMKITGSSNNYLHLRPFS